MTIQKLLGLLFEHIESGEIMDVLFDKFEVVIDAGYITEKVIKLNEDILTQYNKIFGYE